MTGEAQRSLARALGLDVPAGPEPTGLEWIGGAPFGVSETPADAEGDAPADFDGGARQSEPEPADPAKDHGELVAELLRERDPGVSP